MKREDIQFYGIIFLGIVIVVGSVYLVYSAYRDRQRLLKELSK